MQKMALTSILITLILEMVYSICEIETVVASADQTEKALASLYAFAKRHGISPERAEGKIEHYMRIKNPAHYYAIAKSSL